MPGIRQKLASTPTPGAFSTTRRSMRPIVSSMVGMIPVSAPETLALTPNGCWDIPRREEAVESACGKGPIAALYIETPANPTNGMVDLGRARKIVSGLHGPDANRPVIIVDNTMLGPIYQVPLAHGADLVVTSLTKYVGGHSDLIAGGCSGTAAMLEPIRGMRTILGTMCDPHTGWLVMRSLETLKLRMTAAAEGARKVAAFLNAHPKVASVWYLGFLPEGHPDPPVSSANARAQAPLSASK